MMHVEAKAGRNNPSEAPAGGASKGRVVGANGSVDLAVVAAIALAIELEAQPEASRIATQRETSFWALAGRARVLRGR